MHFSSFNKYKIIFTAVFFAALLMVGTYEASAQADRGYVMSLGIKGGKFSSGLSGKYFFGNTNSNAIEANVTVKKNFGTLMTTFFYVHQRPFFNKILQIPLDYFVGAGLHGAFYKEGYYRVKNGEKDAYYGSGISIGVDALVGLEYPLSVAPLTISIEAAPFFDLVNPGPEHVEIAFALRYALGGTTQFKFFKR